MRVMLAIFLLAGAAAVSGLAQAASISVKEAQQRVAAYEKDHSEFLAKLPGFRIIDETIRADCSSKAPGNASSSEYCKCASAVTMSLWRSGADPKMIERLTAFAKDPDPTAAPDFLRFQGPELYKPLCELARG